MIGFLSFTATKEKTVANLANFAYDPYNYSFLRQVKTLTFILEQFSHKYEINIFFLFSFSTEHLLLMIFKQLNVLELFLDCITEPNEKLVEFGVGGICNACVGKPSYWHFLVVSLATKNTFSSKLRRFFKLFYLVIQLMTIYPSPFCLLQIQQTLLLSPSVVVSLLLSNVCQVQLETP